MIFWHVEKWAAVDLDLNITNCVCYTAIEANSLEWGQNPEKNTGDPSPILTILANTDDRYFFL